MPTVDSVVVGLIALVDNREVATGVLIAGILGLAGLLYRFFDRYILHRRSVLVTTIFDQAVNLDTRNIKITVSDDHVKDGSVESLAILRIANSGTEKVSLQAEESDRFSILFRNRIILAIKVREPEELVGQPGRPLDPDDLVELRSRITAYNCMPKGPDGNALNPSRLVLPNDIVLHRRRAFQLVVFLARVPRGPEIAQDRERRRGSIEVTGELLHGRIVHRPDSPLSRFWYGARLPLAACAVVVAFLAGALVTDQATTPQAACVGDLAMNVEGSTAFAHIVTEAAADYDRLCPAARITITADGSDSAIATNTADLHGNTMLMVDYSGQTVPASWQATPIGMVIFGVVANRSFADTVAGTPDEVPPAGYTPPELAKLYRDASGPGASFVAVGRNGNSGTAAEFDQWTHLDPNVLKTASVCPDISAAAAVTPTTFTGICTVGTTQKMLAFVNDNPSAIGFADIDAVTQYPNLEVLAVGGVQPDRSHVLDGTYGFTVPEYLYTTANPAPQVASFLSFMQSPAETARLTDENAGFIRCADLGGAVAGDCTVAH
jgi:ABC-type phosphate transport system substrate-binding protein